ncbi:mcm-domain-containing protein [Phaffia rhodozyma]|uniref:DNA replication licensing factor MCM5 n=1 Tax=Phaffia rhodozyma TaxID=264483 RepID=A0A0F7SJH2_PHARH|nr:mcm-domain-containing protein [Phaffia rhodozyma]
MKYLISHHLPRSGFDSNRVFSVSVLSHQGPHDAPAAIERSLFEFIQGFRVGGEFKYRDRIRSSLLARQNVVEIDLRDLVVYNEELAQMVQEKPGDMLPLLESAILKSARQILHPMNAQQREQQQREREQFTQGGATQADGLLGIAEREIPEMQAVLKSGMNMIQFRELTADTLTTLVRLPGIVISASTLSSRATSLYLQCKGCRSTKVMAVTGGIGDGGARSLPRKCEAEAMPGTVKDCPLDPYVIMHDRCRFVDQQMIKLQEAPDAVPVGELPRHMQLSAERYLTGKVVPGSRVIVTGIYSTYQAGKTRGNASAPALRTPYLRVLGLELDTNLATSPGSRGFTAEEEEEFGEISRGEGLYERFARSVAPSIFGNLDIKKAIACLLFGGSKKILPDGMRLRGDINVLLLGDPGTAKSQLLKFVEKVAPISVYTSGKGSSAAGLTASVQRDPVTREFFLEGGAMVLADGGVVCIDEFDKMRDEDRVAIHEAMEQQTISIAKAGITTILNSRTSVLAAANPVFGRYDDMKSPGENIDFQTTILSRFDMIFIVKDEHNESRDRTIAKHVMNIHMNRPTGSETVGEIDIDKMKRYVAYCKSRCAPRLSQEASEMLSSHFVALRKQVQQVERDNDERSSIPITVRQLEAIIRISESLAKMTLTTSVQPFHVDEAIRLFKYSTMDAVSAGSVEGLTRGELNEEVEKIEREVRRRLPIGWSTSYASLVREFVSGQGYSSHALERTLYIMEKREVLRFSGQKKVVHRVGV